jgi:P-type Cu+ transporter
MPTDQISEVNQTPPANAPPANAAAPLATELAVTGMTCGNCARHVTEALQKVSGVSSALASLDSRRASVRWDSGHEQNVPALIQAIEAAGYGAKVIEAHSHDHAAHELAGWQLNLWIGLIGTGVLMAGEWLFGLGMTRWFQWSSFAVATLVQVFAGAPFYRGAWSQLKSRSANMDTLVSLGSTTAFGYSAWALLSGLGGHLYFMEAAAIISLVSIGHWLESRASVRASGALRKLLNLAPPLARRLSPAGEESEVPVAELRAGDLLVLRPGDRVPTDGQVVEGDSAVDESMLTGESAPVDKATASVLYAGTVNLNGRLLMRVTAVGEQTALAHIIAAVQRAQTSRANIQRLGDRVSGVFVPVVVSVALAAALWWRLAPESARQVHEWLAQLLWHTEPPAGLLAAPFIIAAAVLIVACPCAMGLATPAAIMAGTNAAALRGILIRDGVALEKAGQITAVVFDKTGTLTVGKPSARIVWDQVTGIPGGAQAADLAAALARPSSHPVSQAVAKLSDAKFDLTAWREMPGGGVQAMWNLPDGSRFEVRLGSLRWLQEEEIDLSAASRLIDENSKGGNSLVGLAVERTLRSLILLTDTVKSGSREVVAKLQRQGFKIYLLTGDRSQTAFVIAKQAGIDSENVFAEVRPEQKAEMVKKLQVQGERVAFVGDGINDAPALEQADLGIAVSRASDIAREAADIILLNSEIEAVPEALGLARATLRTIKQNLFWAFFYNAVGVPLAAVGLMSPILCAAAMGLSDLVVIGNALRLRRWRS